jgi:putative addiction module component (TIGR02574 family)
LLNTAKYHPALSDTSITTPSGFDELPKAEQVRFLQALWDQISERPGEIPVPESHLQLAEERLRRYRENPSSAQPAFDVIERLRKTASNALSIRS